MNRRLRPAIAALAFVLAGATLAACGDKDDSKGDSSTKTTSATAGTTLTKADYFKTLSAAQQKSGSAHMTVEIGVAGQTIKADGDLKIGKTLADNLVSMTMDMGQAGFGSMKMILVGTDFYLNFGKVTDGKYAKIDLRDKNNPLTKQFAGLLDQMDPSTQFKQMKGALTSFGKKGSAVDIDGVKAQPYQLVVDTSKLAAFASLPGSVAKSIPPSLTYVMYVGPDNLLRRITYEVAGANAKINYTKWGEPVDIKAPAAGDITDKDPSQLFGAGTRSA